MQLKHTVFDDFSMPVLSATESIIWNSSGTVKTPILILFASLPLLSVAPYNEGESSWCKKLSTNTAGLFNCHFNKAVKEMAGKKSLNFT